MQIQQQIERKLQDQLQPEVLEVVNESSNHNVPAGSESHFKVTIVCKEFDGKPLIARHRMVNKVLADELNGQIHALALHTLTPEQYFERAGKVAASPECLGGGK